jgi:hypothetical protein
MRGRSVGHQHRDGQRRDLAHPRGLKQVILSEQGQRAADSGTDHHRQPLRLHLRRAGVPPGFSRSDHGHLLTTVPTAGLHPRERIGRIDRKLRCDPHG